MQLPNTIKDLPVVTILHGDDEHSINQSVVHICQLMGDPSMAELNISRLDGGQASFEDIQGAVATMPFLAERRMLILSHPLARVNESGRDKFLSFLQNLPKTAALVLIVDDTYERRDWKTLTPKNWLRTWAQSNAGRSIIITHQLPAGEQMAGWIMAHARSLNGQFDAHGAAELAAHVGNDTRLAAMEIEKLLTYVNFKRPVLVDDVNLLTIATNPVNIFDMVDAVAQQNSRKAISLLHHLLDQQEPIALFFMIVRQFRLLIQAREILDEGGSADVIERELKQHPFVAKKLSEQAKRFSMARLEEIYRRLFEMDEAMKTSQVSLELSLDTFIASLA